ncbi:hypothetical protein, partial [Bacteroides sp. HPS0048]|uniref:hypothetical protein n=1 Tax=Bacteroides sp. HPS0048 TaxID=1078089 RepID=UPI003568ECD1
FRIKRNLFCKTLICKGVVKHKNERKRKRGKRRHIIIYTRAYGCAREKKQRRIKRKEEEGDT